MATPAATSAVTDAHPEVLEMEPTWFRIQHALKGSDAVKSNNYLPNLPSHRMDPDARSAYVDRAVWYNASNRTVEALVGASHRREGIVTVPRRYMPRLADLTGRGDSFHTFAKRVTREVIAFGRYGLLVDAGGPAGNIVDPLGRLPFIAGYDAFSIRNWRYRIHRGARVLEQVVLRESVTVPQRFGSSVVCQYRVVELDESGSVVVSLWRGVGSDGGFEELERIVPLRNGKPLDRVPFVFCGPGGTEPEVQKSPISDLVDVNFGHFRNSADYEYSLYLCGAPTVVVNGAPEDMGVVRFGGAILLPQGSDAKLLEFHGDGVQHLERALTAKENLMGVLGARLLESPKRAAETAETVRLRQHGDTSVLAGVARSVSDAIEQAIQISCDWDGIYGPVSVELNQDFFDSAMEPAVLAELVRTVQAGLMPLDDFILQLQKGELIRQNLTIEEVRSLLQTDAPRLMGAPMVLDLVSSRANTDDTPERGEVAA